MTAKPEYIMSALVAEGGKLLQDMLQVHAEFIIESHASYVRKGYVDKALQQNRWLARFATLEPDILALAEPYEVLSRKSHGHPGYVLVQPDERLVVNELLDQILDAPGVNKPEFSKRVVAFTQKAREFLKGTKA